MTDCPTPRDALLDAGVPNADRLDELLAGTLRDPRLLLGAHPRPDGTLVRSWQPGAEEVTVVGADGRRTVLAMAHPAGLFSGVVPAGFFPGLRRGGFGSGPPDYRIEVRRAGRTELREEPYLFDTGIGAFDLHLISEGSHEGLWRVLGAHPQARVVGDRSVPGTSFAVWAPGARGIRVRGDVDRCAGRATPMRALDGSGVWELFVPGVAEGAGYDFEVLGADGVWRAKADPLAFSAAPPPGTTSVVHRSRFTWSDDEWLARRASRPWWQQPLSVYEVHLGSWRPGLGYRELAARLADHVTELGFTHVELLPIAEHPYGGSWGYQVTSYYAPTARFGGPDDFRWFVDHLHSRGIGVLLDWVPAHFPRDEWALAGFDGTPLYEHADPRRGEHPDWGTLIFDHGRPQVRNFLVANALYWVEEFHVDGLRVDAVASLLHLDFSREDGEWEPNVHGGRENLEAVALLRELTERMGRAHPDVLLAAEDSTTWPGVTRRTDEGGLGFGLKWNLGWMHDTLDYLGLDPVERAAQHGRLAFSLSYADTENFLLPLSHDEVVHGKGSLWSRMPGDDAAKAAGVRALFGLMWAHPGRKLLFMGGEFGQVREWSEAAGLDWELLDDPRHEGLRRLVAECNRLYRALPALYTGEDAGAGFSWLDATDAVSNVLAFLRHGADGSTLACVANLAGVAHREHRVGLPAAGIWRERLNTDAREFGGAGTGNRGAVTAEPIPWQGRPASAVLHLPASGVVWLTPE
ncbi:MULTISPECIES: 1,4-alpha-glucan branching protein GlgB [Actinoalloteichus]|uniref:1,4-alpha-glucan branching enzyme GlgB n=1 Tax=Actinoalloteichus fjordicus TaxID=1612552 RepID=A0AAC9PQZ4_9PSEU|nr:MULTISPECIES: 1,4-alpha-glucan branching protein GlgB [Actinoalloteichus]APU13568.1 alpha-1,4-glucan:alpha-1,4-glucan 6-glycosyltransferase [Actinoalloteichus fjordicus]APU19515.1 alpha-1,4-glucan:alpha-1,4-glucan 6-glycosyltransferase [Actinoalloteichus sp. GBA129-24]